MPPARSAAPSLPAVETMMTPSSAARATSSAIASDLSTQWYPNHLDTTVGRGIERCHIRSAVVVEYCGHEIDCQFGTGRDAAKAAVLVMTHHQVSNRNCEVIGRPVCEGAVRPHHRLQLCDSRIF
jgi:hypothetical protein